ncbi:MAG: hypothetical protein ACK5IJ_08975 [Mangrovibacterium sp.]
MGCSKEDESLKPNEVPVKTTLSSDYTDIVASATSLLDESITEALEQLNNKSSSETSITQAIESIYAQKVENQLAGKIEKLKSFTTKSAEVVDTLKVERYTDTFGEWMSSMYEEEDEVSEDQILIDMKAAYADFETYVSNSQDLNESEKLEVLSISYLQQAQLSVVISRFDDLDGIDSDELQTKGWLKKVWNKGDF